MSGKGNYSPRWRYAMQKASAKKRGIAFLLTFDEWWQVWQDSGHWHERGRELGCYVMARHGDAGPYAVGNVSIVTHTQNIVDAHGPRELPLGVYPNGSGFCAKRFVGGKRLHLGTYRTPEEAHAAYLMAAPQTSAAA